MQNLGTQNRDFTVYGSKHIHMHTFSMSEPIEVTGQLHIALAGLTPMKNRTPLSKQTSVQKPSSFNYIFTDMHIFALISLV